MSIINCFVSIECESCSISVYQLQCAYVTNKASRALKVDDYF